jgi:hypothetical protein
MAFSVSTVSETLVMLCGTIFLLIYVAMCAFAYVEFYFQTDGKFKVYSIIDAFYCISM